MRRSRWDRESEDRPMNGGPRRTVSEFKRVKNDCRNGSGCHYGLDCIFQHTDDEWDRFKKEERRWGKNRNRPVSEFKPRERRWKKECHFGLRCKK